MCFLLIKHNHFSGENALQLVRPLISGCWGSAVFGKGIGVSKSPNCESLTVRSIWLVCFEVLVVKCGTAGLRKECILDDQDDECMMLHVYL